MKNKSLSFNHLLTSSNITPNDLSLIISTSLAIKENPKHCQFDHGKDCKVLATLFFEPSTRTRFSFESAILRLGGHFINLEQESSSSISKGESLEDMGRIMSSYADIIVMRHPEKNSVQQFATHASVPVINAGDGAHEHPTQSLTDLTTIYEHKKSLDQLNIGFYGDLKYGRTINSLITSLSLFKNNRFYFISTPELGISDTVKTTLTHNNLNHTEHHRLEDCLSDLDILYVTRTQTERFQSQGNLTSLAPITTTNLKNAKSDLIILHPLPRVTEIHPDVDNLPYANYFNQAKNGLYTRMALMALLLN